MKKEEKQPMVAFSLQAALKHHFPQLFKNLEKYRGWRLRLLAFIVCEKKIASLLLLHGNSKKQATSNGNETDHAKDTISSFLKHSAKPKITVGGLKYLQSLAKNNAKTGSKKKTKCFFIANHPLGGLDGLVLLHLLLPYFPNTRVLTNPLLLELKPLDGVFFPVEVFRPNLFSQAKAIRHLFSSSTTLAAFPARRVAREINGKVIDTVWHPRLLREAVSCKRVLIPTRIIAKNSRWFYLVAKLRKRLGISANIEMLLLPRELLSRKGISIKIVFGKPISPEKLNNIFHRQKGNKQQRWHKIAAILHRYVHGRLF